MLLESCPSWRLYLGPQGEAVRLPASSLQASKFLERCTYVSGTYDQPEGFQALNQALLDREAEHPRSPVGRLYYLALPPSVYPEVTRG